MASWHPKGMAVLDALHAYVREVNGEPVDAEVADCFAMAGEVYDLFGLEPSTELSLRPDQRLGIRAARDDRVPVSTACRSTSRCPCSRMKSSSDVVTLVDLIVHAAGMGSMGLEAGPDGCLRCWWCLGAPELMEYHDRVWGQPMHGERELFEMLVLELFQSGLSWLTILRKRAGFRCAFADWDVAKIANFGARDVQRLMGDADIVRNRAKIEATIANAVATQALHDRGETLDELLWRFAPDPGDGPAPMSGSELPAMTPDSKAMAKELKRNGFRFVGPTTAYALMGAAGLVNDHLEGCEFR